MVGPSGACASVADHERQTTHATERLAPMSNHAHRRNRPQLARPTTADLATAVWLTEQEHQAVAAANEDPTFAFLVEGMAQAWGACLIAERPAVVQILASFGDTLVPMVNIGNRYMIPGGGVVPSEPVTVNHPSNTPPTNEGDTHP